MPDSLPANNYAKGTGSSASAGEMCHTLGFGKAAKAYINLKKKSTSNYNWKSARATWQHSLYNNHRTLLPSRVFSGVCSFPSAPSLSKSNGIM